MSNLIFTVFRCILLQRIFQRTHEIDYLGALRSRRNGNLLPGSFLFSNFQTFSRYVSWNSSGSNSSLDKSLTSRSASVSSDAPTELLARYVFLFTMQLPPRRFAPVAPQKIVSDIFETLEIASRRACRAAKSAILRVCQHFAFNGHAIDGTSVVEFKKSRAA